jgi:hypothetical protein
VLANRWLVHDGFESLRRQRSLELVNIMINRAIIKPVTFSQLETKGCRGEIKKFGLYATAARAVEAAGVLMVLLRHDLDGRDA